MSKTTTVHAQQKWEYVELTRKSAPYLVKELNEYGQKGWELVTMTQALDRKGEVAWTAVLKRPFSDHTSPAKKKAAPVGSQVSPKKQEVEPPAPGSDEQLNGEDYELEIQHEE